jgi:hypothetical protein
MPGTGSGYTRREFLGGAFAAIGSGSLWDSAAAFAGESPVPKADLRIGAATAAISPKPQSGTTLNAWQTLRLPLDIPSGRMANVLALELCEGGSVKDQAIVVSCDLCEIDPQIQEGFRKHVAAQLPGFDLDKLVLLPAYSHSAPVLFKPQYLDEPPFQGPRDYLPLMYERVAEAVVKAWQSRTTQVLVRGRGRAVVGDRSAHGDLLSPDEYDRVLAQMSGDTNASELRDSGVYGQYVFQILCVCDDKKQLKAALMTAPGIIPMPQGDTIGRAEFLYDACNLLRGRYGRELSLHPYVEPTPEPASCLSSCRTSASLPIQLVSVRVPPPIDLGTSPACCFAAEASAKDVGDSVPRSDPDPQAALQTRSDPFAELEKWLASGARELYRGIGAPCLSFFRLGNEARINMLHPGVRALDLPFLRKHVYAMQFHVPGLGDVTVPDSAFLSRLRQLLRSAAASPPIRFPDSLFLSRLRQLLPTV